MAVSASCTGAERVGQSMHNTYTDPPLPDTFIPSLLLTDGLFGSG